MWDIVVLDLFDALVLFFFIKWEIFRSSLIMSIVHVQLFFKKLTMLFVLLHCSQSVTKQI